MLCHIVAHMCLVFVVCRLLYLLQQSSSSLELRTECAVVLGSLAMGTENNIKSLVDCHIIPALLQGWGRKTYSPACRFSVFDEIITASYACCACRSLISGPDLH